MLVKLPNDQLKRDIAGLNCQNNQSTRDNAGLNCQNNQQTRDNLRQSNFRYFFLWDDSGCVYWHKEPLRYCDVTLTLWVNATLELGLSKWQNQEIILRQDSVTFKTHIRAISQIFQVKVGGVKLDLPFVWILLVRVFWSREGAPISNTTQVY